MDKHQSKILILVAILAIFTGIILVFSKNLPKNTNVQTNSNPPPVVNAQETEPVSVTSPDGKFVLTMKTITSKDSASFIFILSDSVNATQKEVFSTDLASGITLSIPQNTFSPDDKYIFLKEDNNGQSDFFVVTPTGTQDISSAFVTKYSANYVITDVTGWAGPTLVVINTNKIDGNLGPSFWYDVSSKGFIPLATRFN